MEKISKREKQLDNNHFWLIVIIGIIAIVLISTLILSFSFSQNISQKEESIIEKTRMSQEKEEGIIEKTEIAQEKISKEKLFEIVKEIVPGSSLQFKTLEGRKTLYIGKVRSLISEQQQTKIMHDYISSELILSIYSICWEIMDSEDINIAIKCLTYFPAINTLVRTTVVAYNFSEEEQWNCIVKEDIQNAIKQGFFERKCYKISYFDSDYLKETSKETTKSKDLKDMGPEKNAYLNQVNFILSETDKIDKRGTEFSNLQDYRWAVYNRYDKKYCGDIQMVWGDMEQLYEDYQQITIPKEIYSQLDNLYLALNEFLTSIVSFYRTNYRFCNAGDFKEKSAWASLYNHYLDEHRDLRRKVNMELAKIS